jgi:hypothetical protein
MGHFSRPIGSPRRIDASRRAVRSYAVGFHLLVIVSFFFEVTGIWCPFNFGTDRSRVFLHDAKLFMLADEP